MCIFSGPVKSVSNTNLFARMSADGKQMLAYQMKYATDKPNAMILPLPIAPQADEHSLRFISLKNYGAFFKHLDNAFPRPVPKSRSLPSLGGLPRPSQNLVVHEVGDFVASFVPTMDDFARLDQRFVIPKSSWDKIPHYADYGFAVFQLKNLNGKPHPIAFEFKTRLQNEIFFPTVHIHDGEVHEREMFDHMLYLQAPEFDKLVGRYQPFSVKDPATKFVRSQDVARHYCDVTKSAGLIKPDQLIHRIQLKGKLENKDVITSVAPRPQNSSRIRLGQMLPIAPSLLGLSWIINRRNQLQDDKST